MNSFKYIIKEHEEGKSIRELLLSFGVGKERIYHFELEKSFYINGNQVNQFEKLQKDQALEIVLNEQIDLAPLGDDLDVVYEDEYFLIVNKPRNILVHGDGSNDITLSNLVAKYYKNHHIRRKIRVCNRLDYDTCGLVIFAKDSMSEAIMNKLIADRKVEKKYYALCHNKFSRKEGQITYRIGRDRHNSQKMRVSSTGKDALTKYVVLKNGLVSLLDVNLYTGRTHQIRLHLSHIKHPILGDKLYGNDGHNVLCLQAYYLKFIHPFTNENVIIKIELNDDLKRICG